VLRNSTRRTLLLAVCTLLLVGFLAIDAANLGNQVGVSSSTSDAALLSPGFNGVSFSSTGLPHTTAEYLFGQKNATQQTVLSGGTDTLSMDIPGGWNPMDLSVRAYQLSVNQSFSRNYDFSSGYSQGGRIYPYYWNNNTNLPSALKAEWDNGTGSKDVYTELVDGQNANSGDSARWTQLVYVNGTNFTQAKLVFYLKVSPSTLGGGNDGKTYAYGYVNRQLVYSSSYGSLSTSYVQQIIDVTSAVSSLSAPINITLSMGFTGHVKLSGFNGFIYFDNASLYVSSSLSPRAVALQLNGVAIVGQQYGTGTVQLHGALTTPFTFTSNTTGRIRFNCNSTIGIYRVKASDLVTFSVQQGPIVNNNVSKASFINDTTLLPWTYISTKYARDVLNVSIPHDWTFSDVVFPNGGVSGESAGRIKKYDNGSSWIIMINATSIGSYGPNPYKVQAASTNYLGPISTFRKTGGNWISGDFFVNESMMMVNTTVQGGGSSQGNAYAVFYNASDYSLWRNMSKYTIAPGSNGVLSFNFAWSDTNVTRSSLISLVKWTNSTEVGVNWIPITFDLTPPQVRISLPYSSSCAGGVANITVSNMDAHPENITLFINGSQVATGTSSASYSWNTKLFPDGPVQVSATGWDLVGHVNTTTLQVIVDNTPPTLTANLPTNFSYVHKIVTLSASFTDANPGNVTIFVAGFSPSGSPSISFPWPTTMIADGLVNVTAISWDQAGNFNRTTSFVWVDNTPPSLSMNVLPVVSQFIRGNVTINISCTDAHFKNVTLSSSAFTDITWTSTNPIYKWNTTSLSDGAYVLTVNGWDLAGNNRTISMTIITDNTPPSVPSPIYPNNGEEFNVTTLTSPISWSQSSDSGSGVTQYILQLDTSPLFNTANLRTIPINAVPFPSYQIPGSSPLSNGTWYWHASAVDSVGNTGSYSVTRSFQVIVRLAPPPEGLPMPIIIGVGAFSAVAVLSSVVLLRRRRKAEPETYDRKSLIVAYVFSGDGRALFTHQFMEVKVEPQLVSGFLTAITEMMKEVIGGDRRPLRTIERSDAKIIIEFGTMVTGALVSKKASREYRRRLKAFINRFEDDYADKIPKWDGDQSVFQAAPEVIEEVFSEKTKVATYPTIAGLEDLLFSEKLSGVTIAVEGKTGSGKTEFCLQYASSLIKRGKPVIIVASSLPPKDVREVLKDNDVDFAKAEKAGNLVIYDAFSESSGVHSSEKYRFGSPGELNSMNLAISKNLSELKKATIIFDSLSAMIDYSELELAVDFVRTIKAKVSDGGHTAFFIIDSNAHDKNQMNYLLTVMDGEIETMTETTKKGESERLVSFKRLKGFKVKPGYHELK
jgi:KaiC/GvpD/RAD55 family RecA-like ATPase